jgi:TnpA family transposase
MLGIDVRPRIRRWKDVVLYKPSFDSDIDFLPGMWRGSIDWDLIESQFEDVLRVVISIQQGTIIPSTLLKHLGTYSRRNKLYQALREIGRVVRTMVILDYITNEDEQRTVQKVTNMVEHYNRFNDWFVIGERGVIRDNDPDEFDKRVKYRDLIANCAILQNVVDLTRIFKELIDKGYDISREDIQQITPYLTQHIKRFGEFVIDLSQPFSITDEDMRLPDSLMNSPDNTPKQEK